LAAGGTLAALEELKVGKAELGLVLARPPGHHASADTAMGFCLINNVAVAAASLADQGERVLILDWDVHHGNGTQAIFYNDPRVLYVSTHQAPFYPGTGGLGEIGGPQASGLTVNLPLPAGATGDIVAKVLDEVATPVIERFAPTWVVVSAGFDGHRDDPLADLALTAGDFADLATRARGFAPAPGRLLIVLEGGYDLNALKHSMAATLSAALGENYRPEPSSSGGPGADHIEAARRVHAVQLS
ncbi:MAG: histone deacetylase, partial [Actinobacteria bacterium]|nr:histone deacetylase [Actinomycetota bacterium]